MKKNNISTRGIFSASVNHIRKKAGRYYISLNIYEMNRCITIDINDSICEALGTSNFNTNLIKKMLSEFPRTIRVSNLNGYWKIENEQQIFCDALSKIL